MTDNDLLLDDADRAILNRIQSDFPITARPYLAIAASLACGYLGMIENLKPSDPIAGSAYELPFALPMTLADSLRMLRGNKALLEVFGERFVAAYSAVKESEYETFLRVISSWEREHLLLNV